MEYLTTKEIADKWKITARRVTKLCNEGRIVGAITKGNMWLIPDMTEKPEDYKRGKKRKEVMENAQKK